MHKKILQYLNMKNFFWRKKSYSTVFILYPPIFHSLLSKLTINNKINGIPMDIGVISQ